MNASQWESFPAILTNHNTNSTHATNQSQGFLDSNQSEASSLWITTSSFEIPIPNQSELLWINESRPGFPSLPVLSERTEYLIPEIQPAVLVTCAVLMLLNTIVGTQANVIICVAVASSKALRTGMNALIVNLSIADLINCSVCSTLLVTAALGYMMGSKNSVPASLCHILDSVHVLGGTVQLITVGSISLERYQALNKPFENKYVIIRTKVTLVTSWTLGILYMTLAWTLFEDSPTLLLCVVPPGESGLASRYLSYKMGIYLFVPLTFLTVCVILVFYGRILFLIQKHVKSTEGSLGGGGKKGKSKDKGKKTAAKGNSTKMLTSVKGKIKRNQIAPMEEAVKTIKSIMIDNVLPSGFTLVENDPTGSKLSMGAIEKDETSTLNPMDAYKDEYEGAAVNNELGNIPIKTVSAQVPILPISQPTMTKAITNGSVMHAAHDPPSELIISDKSHENTESARVPEIHSNAQNVHVEPSPPGAGKKDTNDVKNKRKRVTSFDKSSIPNNDSGFCEILDPVVNPPRIELAPGTSDPGRNPTFTVTTRVVESQGTTVGPKKELLGNCVESVESETKATETRGSSMGAPAPGIASAPLQGGNASPTRALDTQAPVLNANPQTGKVDAIDRKSPTVAEAEFSESLTVIIDTILDVVNPHTSDGMNSEFNSKTTTKGQLETNGDNSIDASGLAVCSDNEERDPFFANIQSKLHHVVSSHSTTNNPEEEQQEVWNDYSRTSLEVPEAYQPTLPNLQDSDTGTQTVSQVEQNISSINKEHPMTTQNLHQLNEHHPRNPKKPISDNPRDTNPTSYSVHIRNLSGSSETSHPGLSPGEGKTASYPGSSPGEGTTASYPGSSPGESTTASYPGSRQEPMMNQPHLSTGEGSHEVPGYKELAESEVSENENVYRKEEEKKEGNVTTAKLTTDMETPFSVAHTRTPLEQTAAQGPQVCETDKRKERTEGRRDAESLQMENLDRGQAETVTIRGSDVIVSRTQDNNTSVPGDNTHVAGGDVVTTKSDDQNPPGDGAVNKAPSGGKKRSKVKGGALKPKSSVVKIYDADGQTMKAKTSRANVTGDICVINPSNKIKGKRKLEAKSAKRAAIVLVTFLVAWLPFPLVIMFSWFVNEQGNYHQAANLVSAYIAAMSLSLLAASVNPLVYGAINKQFYKEFKKMYKKCKQRSCCKTMSIKRIQVRQK